MTWAPLPLADWQPTYDTLHLWLQVVGKIRIATTPPINHTWNSALYLTSRGMTTSPMPYKDGAFEISLDFIDHQLIIDTSWGPRRTIELRPMTSADFHAAIMKSLSELGITIHIWPVTVEMPEKIHLDTDREHAAYDREYVTRWWRIMVTTGSIFQEFRARFIGKCSPVHFFWGSMDLAVTRFSGRRAPPRTDPDAFMREAYSHEVISLGFWPGSGTLLDPAFYAYAAPEPEGYDKAQIQPAQARYDTTMRIYILMYDDVRNSPSPRQTLLDFAQSTYEAGANLGGWNRAELERSP